MELRAVPYVMLEGAVQLIDVVTCVTVAGIELELLARNFTSPA
jgi:hypothetical protein